MAKLHQTELEQYILAQAFEGTTYQSLCLAYDADHTQKMQIDRTLQKLRRKGYIHVSRQGRDVYWVKSEF